MFTTCNCAVTHVPQYVFCYFLVSRIYFHVDTLAAVVHINNACITGKISMFKTHIITSYAYLLLLAFGSFIVILILYTFFFNDKLCRRSLYAEIYRIYKNVPCTPRNVPRLAYYCLAGMCKMCTSARILGGFFYVRPNTSSFFIFCF